MARTKPIQFYLSTAIGLMLAAAVLVWLLIAYWPRSRPPQRESPTRALLGCIAIACEAYEFDWDAYPPEFAPNGARGAESLYYYLTTPFRSVPNLAKGEVKTSKNFGPYMEVRAEQLVTGPTGRHSIVDSWGQSFEYDNIRDDPIRTDGFTPRPNDPRTDGKPRNAQRFDLWSPGPPGKNEPITNWK